MCASANEKRRFGTSPLSVDGGTSTSGFSASIVGSRGPMSVPPFVDLIGSGIGSAPAAWLRMATPTIAVVPVRRTDLRLIGLNGGLDIRSGPEFIGLGGL